MKKNSKTKPKNKKSKRIIDPKIKKSNFLLILILFIFIGIFVRAAMLSLSEEIDGKNLKLFAASRTTKRDTILAKRGTIYDNNGEALAQNVYSYTLIAYLAESRGEGNYVKDKEKTAKALATVISMDESRILSLLNSKNKKGEPLYQTEFGNAGKGLTELTKDKIEALNLDGIDFIESQKRYYPKGDFLSYTLGYAKQDANGKINGELGLESLFNDALTGTDGYKEYQKDLRGYKIANTHEEVVEAKDGDNIYLTIDSNVQFFLEQALENANDKYNFEQLNIIVAEAKTGKILGISTTPSFDPNERNITNYLDPNISVAIEPGSTMKIFSYMAVMEAGKYNGDETFKSGTFVTKDKTEIGDWDRKGWGHITYDHGFALSSNVGVVNLIDKYIDREILKNYYKKLGFGSKTGIELSKETSGKLDFKYETEVFNAGFGQGILTTSIQNIKALTALANDGVLLQPYIVEKQVDSDGNVVKQNTRTEIERVASKETTDKIKELMEQVVIDGTGSVYYMDGYGIIAKTGTAQIASTNGTGYLTGPNDVIRGFAGMFPKNDPQIIIYANLKKPNPNSPNALVSVIKEVVENISKYYNIYDETKIEEQQPTYSISSYINQETSKVKEELEKNGMKVYVIGNGTKITNQYPNANITLNKNSKVFLVTNNNQYIIPDFSGWAKKDVITYLTATNIPYETIGNGYLTKQNIEKNTLYVNEMGKLILNFELKYTKEEKENKET